MVPTVKMMHGDKVEDRIRFECMHNKIVGMVMGAPCGSGAIVGGTVWGGADTKAYPIHRG